MVICDMTRPQVIPPGHDCAALHCDEEAIDERCPYHRVPRGIGLSEWSMAKKRQTDGVCGQPSVIMPRR